MRSAATVPSSWTRSDDVEESQCCVTMENIYAAAKRIEGGIVRSSCRRSRNLSALTGCDIFLKAGEHMPNFKSIGLTDTNGQNICKIRDLLKNVVL